jgi:hypothetical protein
MSVWRAQAERRTKAQAVFSRAPTTVAIDGAPGSWQKVAFLLGGHRELALLDACQTAPSALADSTFALKEAPVPTPDPGQALTRTIYVSLDLYQWGYERRGEEPEATPCHARKVSQVVESRIDGLAPGDFVCNTRATCSE